MFQKGEIDESSVSFCSRFNGNQWSASVFVPHMSAVLEVIGYHQKISDRVEVGSEIVVPFRQTEQSEVITKVGGKIEFAIDTTGKLAMYFEQRLAGALSFLLSGEIDHVTTSCKFGFGIQVG